MNQKLSQVLMKNMLVITISAVLSITGLLVMVVRSDINRLLEGETISTMGIIDKQIHNYFKHPVSEMTYIRDGLDNPGTSEKDIVHTYNTCALPDSSFHHLDVVDDKGTITAVMGGDVARIGFDLSKNTAYQSILNADKDHIIGGMKFDAVMEAPTLYIVMAYSQGYIIGYLDLAMISQIVDGVELRQGYIGIVDDSGKYIGHTNTNLVNERSVDPHFRKIIAGDLKTGSQVKYLGKDVILHFQKASVGKLYIFYYQGLEEYAQATNRMLGSAFVAVMFFLPIVILVILRITRNIRRSFDEMNVHINKIGEGDYSKEETKAYYEEFDNLLRAFIHMSEEVEGREKEISKLSGNLEENYYETVFLLAKAIEAKDTYTGNHCERVTEYALALGEALYLSQEDMRELRIGSALHDIGKISIPEAILNKPGRLTKEEFDIIKEHSRRGYDIIKDLSRMRGAKEVILYHHEKYDGSGYPTGLAGEDIPLLARIVMIADAYDAMVSNRSYRKCTMSMEVALAEIEGCAGTQFDPELAKLFCQLMRDNVKKL